jgi:hypothetical protein
LPNSDAALQEEGNASKNEGQGRQEAHPGRQKVGQALAEETTEVRDRPEGASAHTQEASSAVETAVINVTAD